MLRNKMAAPPLLSHFPISTWPYPRGRGSNERANRKLENGFGRRKIFYKWSVTLEPVGTDRYRLFAVL